MILRSSGFLATVVPTTGFHQAKDVHKSWLYQLVQRGRCRHGGVLIGTERRHGHLVQDVAYLAELPAYGPTRISEKCRVAHFWIVSIVDVLVCHIGEQQHHLRRPAVESKFMEVRYARIKVNFSACYFPKKTVR